MIFRKAEDRDIPAIIELLKISLGESMIPKSEALWRWKHITNPFGPSPVWIAEAEGKLVGARAFMRWEFRKGQKNYKALRAVDTATHPQWQGKGIFSRLTQKALEDCQAAGDDFIFNTPNEQSMPGYLKLGWHKKGKLPLRIQINRPFSLLKNLFYKNSIAKPPKLGKDWENLPELEKRNTPLLSTPLSAQYLDWRYARCPLFDYGYATDEKTYLLIYRIKIHSYGHELRVVELLPLHDTLKPNLSQLKKTLTKLSHQYHPVFTSYSGWGSIQMPIQGFGWTPAVNLGPMVTLRDLNLKGDFNHLLIEKGIGFSLGDLELF